MPPGIADAALLCDLSALHNFRDDLESFPGIVFLNLPEQKKWTEENCPDWAYSVERHYGGGLSDDGLCWNGNTGAAAINLALLCGANRVYLLGFDMNAEDPKNPDWYREDDEWDKNNPAIKERFDNWLEMFPRIERDRKLLFPEVEIINVNDNSALSVFSKITVQRFVDIATENNPHPIKKMDGGKKSIYFQNAYLGFGDNFYIRPFLREVAKQHNVFLHTAVPEAFWDISGVFPVRPREGSCGCKLRTQRKNIKRTVEEWFHLPKDAKMLGWPRYHIGSHAGSNPWAAFRTFFRNGVPDVDGSFFPRKEWIVSAGRLIAEHGRQDHQRVVLVKPPSIRKEWISTAREPMTKYIQQAIDAVRKHSNNSFIVFIGDTQSGEEDLVKPVITGADCEFMQGELPFSTLLGMMSMSELLVSGVGNFLPIGISLMVPTFIVFGGAYPIDELVDDEMNLSKFGYVAPDPFCACRNLRHTCNKEIGKSAMKKTFGSFLKRHWR
jgi:hypothetical protein